MTGLLGAIGTAGVAPLFESFLLSVDPNSSIITKATTEDSMDVTMEGEGSISATAATTSSVVVAATLVPGTLLMSNATAAFDELEIALRRHGLTLVASRSDIPSDESKNEPVSVQNNKSLQTFWNDTLQCIHQIVESVEQKQQQAKDDEKNIAVATDETVGSSNKLVLTSIQIQSILPRTSFLRKLLIVILDDILDTLPSSEATAVWTACIFPGSLLFSEVIWNARQRPCWLPFLKVANKFMRRLQSSADNNDNCNDNNNNNRLLFASEIAAAQVLVLLSTVYPMAEKSAIRIWGSHNADHWTEYESALEFSVSEQAEAAAASEENNMEPNVDDDGNAIASNVAAKYTTQSSNSISRSMVVPTQASLPDFNFYETFWRLQHDFLNVNSIVVADFLHRLKVVLNCLKRNQMEPKFDDTISALESNDITRQRQQKQERQREMLLRPYLTHSRLLPIQLTDPMLRTTLLTQLCIVARHLMDQVPPLRLQLQTHLVSTESLFPDDDNSHTSRSQSILEFILSHSEPHWRSWKQNKCLPDMEQKQQFEKNEPSRKRKRFCDAVGVDIKDVQNRDTMGYEWVGSDLVAVSQRMRSFVPTYQKFLEEYVEALDPESGIEAEYHPKSDALFCWRSLRLLAATEHLADFEHILPNGDFEGMVRHVYTNHLEVEIPGQWDALQDDDDDSSTIVPESMGQINSSGVVGKSADENADENEELDDTDNIASGEMIETTTEPVESLKENNEDEKTIEAAEDAPSKEPQPKERETIISIKSSTDIKKGESHRSNSIENAEKQRPPVNANRLQEGLDRHRAVNGHSRDSKVRNDHDRREPRDLGHSSSRRPESLRDGQSRRDDRALGLNQSLPQRDDRGRGSRNGATATSGGDMDVRRDDRRVDGDVRRDDRRSDRGRSDYDNNGRRVGGRGNPGRR